MNKALIVIDIKRHAKYANEIDLAGKIIEHIRASNYDYIYFTLFQNKPDSNFVKQLDWDKAMSDKETELDGIFAPYITLNNHFVKNTYSCLKQSDLTKALQENNVTELDLCGVDTDACVLATAYDAFDQGYKVNVLTDLCYSKSKDLHEIAKKIITRNIQG